MTKVFQTKIGNGKNGTPSGNCMQAVVASLFDLKLDDVPNFRELDKGNGEGNLRMFQFFEERGYEPTVFGTYNTTLDAYKKVCLADGGIGGYFYASVKSQTFENGFHAVVVDSNMQVVHDPNPNGKCLGIKLEGSLNYIITFGSGWYIDKNDNIIENGR